LPLSTERRIALNIVQKLPISQNESCSPWAGATSIPFNTRPVQTELDWSRVVTALAPSDGVLLRVSIPLLGLSVPGASISL